MLEIERLDRMLRAAGIPFERMDDNNFRRVKYPVVEADENIISVVQGRYSYGGNENLLETMDEYGNVAGWLTAEVVFARIKEHWDKQGDIGFVKGVRK